jgi:hypothetical protein
VLLQLFDSVDIKIDGLPNPISCLQTVGDEPSADGWHRS